MSYRPQPPKKGENLKDSDTINVRETARDTYLDLKISDKHGNVLKVIEDGVYVPPNGSLVLGELVDGAVQVRGDRSLLLLKDHVTKVTLPKMPTSSVIRELVILRDSGNSLPLIIEWVRGVEVGSVVGPNRITLDPSNHIRLFQTEPQGWILSTEQGVHTSDVLAAYRWAESPQNPDPTLVGSKSAKTWAMEAKASAAAAANLQQVALQEILSQVEPLVEEAETSAATAVDAATRAEATAESLDGVQEAVEMAAEAAQLSATSASTYSGYASAGASSAMTSASLAAGAAARAEGAEEAAVTAAGVAEDAAVIAQQVLDRASWEQTYVLTLEAGQTLVETDHLGRDIEIGSQHALVFMGVPAAPLTYGIDFTINSDRKLVLSEPVTEPTHMVINTRGMVTTSSEAQSIIDAYLVQVSEDLTSLVQEARDIKDQMDNFSIKDDVYVLTLPAGMSQIEVDYKGRPVRVFSGSVTVLAGTPSIALTPEIDFTVDANGQINLTRPVTTDTHFYISTREKVAGFNDAQALIDGYVDEVSGYAEQARLEADRAEAAGVPYPNYASALSAPKPPTQTLISAIVRGNLIEWVRQAGGPCLGGGWAPAGRWTPEHFASDAEFTAATTASGQSYPSPSIARFDLPPQEISLMQAGVVPSNLAADASNNVGAFQTLIDWLTSKNNGGTITSGSFNPRYSSPIITLNEPIILKPKVNFDFNRSVRFRATTVMPAMVDTVVGASNRLRGQSILGGTWDAGRLAERCFNFREFEDINFGGDNMELRAASRSPLSLGDPERSANNYGFYLSRAKITNSTAPYGAGAVAGIEIASGISDCTFDRLLIVGYPRGMVGRLWISRANNIHVWSYPGTTGPCRVGFACDGGDNVFSALQVDNPYEAAFEIVGGNNYRFIGCTSTYDFGSITDPNAPSDLSTYVFKNTALANNLTIVGAYGSDTPATRFAGLIDHYPADTPVSGTLRYGPRQINRDPRAVRFNPSEPPDYIGQDAISDGRVYKAVSTSLWQQVAQSPANLPYAASFTPNRRAGHIRVDNLTGNITINAPSETPLSGDRLTLSFVQDATGGRTITWDAVYIGGPTGSGTPGGRCTVSFVYDGFRYVLENGGWL